MSRIFLDATVLFADALSKTGASRELLYLAQRGEVELVTNEIAVIEADRNLTAKNPDSVVLFRLFMKTGLVAIVANPSKELVETVASYTVLKDAPIVAGAIETESDYLATFDRKHLINPPEVSEKAGITIATSGDILNVIRESG